MVQGKNATLRFDGIVLLLALCVPTGCTQQNSESDEQRRFSKKIKGEYGACVSVSFNPWPPRASEQVYFWASADLFRGDDFLNLSRIDHRFSIGRFSLSDAVPGLGSGTRHRSFTMSLNCYA